MRAPHVKRIENLFGLSQEAAAGLRRLVQIADPYYPGSIDRVLDYANQVLAKTTQGAYGVEAIRTEDFWDPFYGDAVLLYVERGDPYIPTVIYDTQKELFIFRSWGDLVERDRRFQKEVAYG